MVSKIGFRLVCSLIGLLGIIAILASGAKGWGVAAIILICVFIIAYGYFATGKWGKFIIGGEQMDSRAGSLGTE